MKLFYVLGGGLGHLTRVKRLLRTLRIEKDFMIFSTSWATKVFPADQCIIINPKTYQNKKDLFHFLLTQIKQYSVTDLFIDTFPLGLFKELELEVIPSQCQLHYIARYLKWGVYMNQPVVKERRFDHTYIIDFMHQDQFHFIKKHSKKISHFKLESREKVKSNKKEEEFFLINHSGPKEEIQSLINLLQDHPLYTTCQLPILINTPTHFTLPFSERVKVIHQYPAHLLFAQAKLIVTGCGYNSMLETLPYQEKHIFMPFQRKFDDQFERANRRKSLNAL
ncbi:hypothetical protein [Flammeovirga sp. SJP92]|uniref:hypothetical protein n=1 Tax=Flammeovirga sp. SJP92 TaxID=1775430 RepID=UPI00078997B5|nr:hypothetical protein [Flammeovirga sp. SJP92]KXX68908.1 hypothetical protein AVL50_17260 [Flammeovirga sp. SJP92]